MARPGLEPGTPRLSENKNIALSEIKYLQISVFCAMGCRTVSLAEAEEGDAGKLSDHLEPHDLLVELAYDLQVVDAQGDLTKGSDCSWEPTEALRRCDNAAQGSAAGCKD
jgi:hypothetical protein